MIASVARRHGALLLAHDADLSRVAMRPRDRNGRGVAQPLSRRYFGRGTWKKQVPRTSNVPSSFKMCASAMAIARPLRTI